MQAHTSDKSGSTTSRRMRRITQLSLASALFAGGALMTAHAVGAQPVIPRATGGDAADPSSSSLSSLNSMRQSIESSLLGPASTSSSDDDDTSSASTTSEATSEADSTASTSESTTTTSAAETTDTTDTTGSTDTTATTTTAETGIEAGLEAVVGLALMGSGGGLVRRTRRRPRRDFIV